MSSPVPDVVSSLPAEVNVTPASNSLPPALAHQADESPRASLPPWRRPAMVITGLGLVAVVLADYLTATFAGSDSTAAAWVSELGQLLAALVATGASVAALHRHTGRHRRAWLLVALACGSWSIGQLYWCDLVLILGEDGPQVSIADLFFLLFTGLMAFAVWPAEGRRTDRLRTLLDAFIIGMSLFVISWVTSIHHVTAATTGETDRLGLLINLAYPFGDIIVLTMVVLSASLRRGRSPGLAAVAVAMALIAISDGFYAYLSEVSDFESGSVAGLGWIAGFGLIGCAAFGSGRPPRGRRAVEDEPAVRDRKLRRRSVAMLPYLPLGVALVVVAVDRIDHEADLVTPLVIVAIFVGVLLRQYLTILENQALTRNIERRELDLQRQAYQDQLTGLPNRAMFKKAATHALKRHRENGPALSLLFVDLDDFKVVNDTLGHQVGDELVIRVAQRLQGAIRSSDTVARFGGDEFAVLVADDGDATHVATRVVDALRQPFALAGEQLVIGASVGIAEVTSEHQTPELDDLFARADIAMYAAKRAGKGQIALYDASMVLPEAVDLYYRPLLINAVQQGSIECVFQPIIDVATGRVHSMEALARWQVDDQVVTPDYFINLAGRLGLLPELTSLMLEQACGQLADWSVRYDRNDLKVGVNLPAGLLTDRDFPRLVAAALQRHGLGADRLLLEITEDALLGETDVAGRVAERLVHEGVHLWLDDFGTGYSSLLSLRRIPLQGVKIDMAFVETIHSDPSAKQFLQALLVLCRDLGLLVTAEGIERPEQADVLRSLGCQFAQGYLYAHPAPSAELDNLLGRAAWPPESGSDHVDRRHRHPPSKSSADRGTGATVAVL